MPQSGIKLIKFIFVNDIFLFTLIYTDIFFCLTFAPCFYLYMLSWSYDKKAFPLGG